jgi:hypothetical protein
MTAPDFKALLADAKLPEKTVPTCLRGDLVAEHEAAERELEQAQNQQGDSLAGSGVGALADRIGALEAQMRASTYPFRLRALPKPKWRALCAEHPPRRGEDGEVVDTDRIGVNAETFYDAIIRACLVDPQMDDTDWSALVDALTDRQYDELADAAWGLNRREVDIPFSRAASKAKRGSADE